MANPKITLPQLRRLIREEAKAQAIHKAKAAVSSAAGDLMDAINKFKEKATPEAMNAVAPHIDALWKVLDHMNDAPGAYIQTPKLEPKVVSLKAVKND